MAPPNRSAPYSIDSQSLKHVKHGKSKPEASVEAGAAQGPPLRRHGSLAGRLASGRSAFRSMHLLAGRSAPAGGRMGWREPTVRGPGTQALRICRGTNQSFWLGAMLLLRGVSPVPVPPRWALPCPRHRDASPGRQLLSAAPGACQDSRWGPLCGRQQYLLELEPGELQRDVSAVL